MQEAQGTFEIPSDILTSVRRYYVNTSIYLLKMTSKDGAAEQVDNMLNETKKLNPKHYCYLKLTWKSLLPG
jgi:hypothetical protein